MSSPDQQPPKHPRRGSLNFVFGRKDKKKNSPLTSPNQTSPILTNRPKSFMIDAVTPAHCSTFRNMSLDEDRLSLSLPSSEMLSDAFIENEPDMAFYKFMKHHRCYDVMPTSSKLVVFDTRLLVKRAFFALVANGVRSAPLWDSATQEYVGMLTISDFIKILHKNYQSPLVKMEELEEKTIWEWRKILGAKDCMVRISPMATLYEAVHLLVKNKIHRLPVVCPETGNAFFVLTHKRILKFLHLFLEEKHIVPPKFMFQSIEKLGIGTYENIITITQDTPILTALQLFVKHELSALPVVDSNGKVINIYAKFDVINLAAERSYHNLDVAMKQALAHRSHYFEGVASCKGSDTLENVVNKLIKAEVHRLVIVDDKSRVKGVVSLSDILIYLVLKYSPMRHRSKSGV